MNARVLQGNLDRFVFSESYDGGEIKQEGKHMGIQSFHSGHTAFVWRSKEEEVCGKILQTGAQFTQGLTNASTLILCFAHKEHNNIN